jgi:alpha-ketoglutarate-dependent 2,4-dichlorophenoxyacetate dioxygenase
LVVNPLLKSGAMTISARPLHPLFAAELSGIDLRDAADPAALAGFVAAMNRYAVCVVHHDRPLTDAEHIAFSARLGPMERGAAPKVAGTDRRVPHPEIIDQSNLDEFGEIYDDADRRMIYKRANRQWHTDMSFYPVRATWSLLSAHLVPPAGADTELADMRAAYDALPAATKARIEGLTALHSYWHSRKTGGGPDPTEAERRTRPPVRWPLVHVHPGSGRKALYIASHIERIEGLDEAGSRALLAELMDHATRPEFVFAHRWRAGDVLIWDNLCTMHRATPFDDRRYRRDMRRTTVRERGPDPD